MDDDEAVWADVGERLAALAADLTEQGWEVTQRWDRLLGSVTMTVKMPRLSHHDAVRSADSGEPSP